MKQIAPLALALTLATPTLAQDADDGGSFSEGFDLFSEGSRIILENLVEEMRPMFEEHMLPLLAALSDMVDDISAYEMPERLPNGDIIIRRREPLDPEAGEDTETVEEPIDL